MSAGEYAEGGSLVILVDWQIREAIASGHIGVKPYDPKFVQPNSLDIRLGDHFVWYEEGEEVIDPYDAGSIGSKTAEVHAESFVIEPGRFVLAETLEEITLPDDIVASIEGKSSIARLGVELHQTGGWIDAGFSGTITLEMCNVNQRPVRVYAAMPIGQLVFYTTEHAEEPYNVKKGAKYQHQHQATLSRYHENPKG